jgi:hypothetical protein
VIIPHKDLHVRLRVRLLASGSNKSLPHLPVGSKIRRQTILISVAESFLARVECFIPPLLCLEDIKRLEEEVFLALVKLLHGPELWVHQLFQNVVSASVCPQHAVVKVELFFCSEAPV